MSHDDIPPSYRAHQQRVEDGFSQLRQRPAMYIGSTDARGLHHLIYEVVENSIAEAREVYCTRIDVTLAADRTVTVEDNGRGIPIGHDPSTGISALDTTMTRLGGWARRESSSQRYKVAGGLCGVGIATVNALSERLTVVVQRGGRRYHQEYAHGVPRAPVAVIGEATGTGTRISFVPNHEIMADEFSYEVLDDRFRELAYLNSGVEFTFRDERTGAFQEHRFRFDEGLAAFVRYLNRRSWHTLLEPICVTGEIERGELDLAFQYTTRGSDEIVRGYANNVETPQGGTHLTGFRSALREAITHYGRSAGILPAERDPLESGEIPPGLTAVISLHLDHPRFENNMRGRLGNEEVHGEVKRVVIAQLLAFFADHPDQARAIVERCLANPDPR